MVHILTLAITYIYCQVSSVCRRCIIFNVARNKLKFVCLKLRLMRVFDFKSGREQPCRWLSGTNNWVRAHAGDVIMWRNAHYNTEPNAIWFPAMLTDTDLNIQGIHVKYRTNGHCNIQATESRIWGTKWYYLLSAQVCMLRRRVFGIFFTTIFISTFKNCVSRRGSSKGYGDRWIPRTNGQLRGKCFHLMTPSCQFSLFRYFWISVNHHNTDCLVNIVFIFDWCRYRLAAGTPVTHECDSKVIASTSPK